MNELPIRIGDILQGITALGVFVAMMLNLRTMRANGQAANPHTIEIRADVKHIREKVDEQGILTRQLDEKHDKLRDRVTAVEASAKQAHKRLDDINSARRV